MTVPIDRVTIPHVILGVGMLGAFAACNKAPATESPKHPQQAGQPLDPTSLALRIASTRAAALTGDQAAVQRQMQGMQEDFRKSIKLADPSRRIDHEAARAAARGVPGMRSVVWVDQENLLAMVDRNDLRSQQTIDGICMRLEPLGDTLGVVVNLQSAAGRTADELEILSRNCQLAPDDRAFMQRKRQLDVVSAEVRALQRSTDAVTHTSAAPGRKDRVDEKALEGIPEM